MKRYPKYGTKKYTTSAGNPRLRKGQKGYFPDKVEGRDEDGDLVKYWLSDWVEHSAMYTNAAEKVDPDPYATPKDYFWVRRIARKRGNAKVGDFLLYNEDMPDSLLYPSMSAALNALVSGKVGSGKVWEVKASASASPAKLRNAATKRKNPRKISVEAADALMKGREYKKSNTEVVQIGDTDFLLVLHGNQIAEYDTSDGSLYVSDGGYTPMSPTTKDRLNALPGVEVHTSQKQLYLNGQRWSGKWEQMSGPKEPQWDHADQDHLEWH